VKPKLRRVLGMHECSSETHSATGHTAEEAYVKWAAVQASHGLRPFRYRCPLNHEFSALAKRPEDLMMCPHCGWDIEGQRLSVPATCLGEGELRQVGGPVMHEPQPPMILLQSSSRSE